MSGRNAVVLDRRSPLPLWAQLHDDLRRRLDDGAFDAAFPGELALAGEYSVSRQTVREALRRLRSDGLVIAERGRAPRLATPAFDQPLGALASLFASVESRGLEQRSEVRRLAVTADGLVAARLGLEESTPLLHLERLRLAGGEPLALDRVWLPAASTTPLLEADFTRTSLYDELLGRCGVRLGAGQEVVRALVATAAERRTLAIGADVALLAIDRLSCSGGLPFEWRQTLVRGDRFAVTSGGSAQAPPLTLGATPWRPGAPPRPTSSPTQRSTA